MKPKSCWLNQKTMALSCGVSLTTFQRWGVRPVARIGRQVFYSLRDVLDNRLDNHAFGPGSALAKMSPGHAEYARERISGLLADIDKLEKKLKVA